MRSFACGVCGRLVYFENTMCVRCKTRLAFDADQLEVVPREERPLCTCAALNRCNWLVSDPDEMCRSCVLTRTRPNDDDAAGLEALPRAEAAKRRVVFQLLDLELPIGDDLQFDLLSSVHGPVTTGHKSGLITVDLAETDDARREARRRQLGEPYRTMLGHLRHELGHYYQPILVGEDWDRCRSLFGDERTSYKDELERHYREGPPADWSQRHVSAYATMHPWEDWAETFAHYLHIRDTLQTAAEFGIRVDGPQARDFDRTLKAAPQPEAGERGFAEVLENWLPLTYALNAVNRSMGKDDLYPFVLRAPVIEKLAYVHERVHDISAAGD